MVKNNIAKAIGVYYRKTPNFLFSLVVPKITATV